MRENSTQIRQEVQKFIVATEQLYKFLAGGKSLTVHEVEVVSCCMHELLAKGSGDEATVRALRTCVNRQQPFGTADWQATTAATLGLSSTLRKRGRPRKLPET